MNDLFVTLFFNADNQARLVENAIILNARLLHSDIRMHLYLRIKAALYGVC